MFAFESFPGRPRGLHRSIRQRSVLLVALVAWLLPVGASASEALLDRAKSWYELSCGDRTVNVFPADESDALLKKLSKANDDTGEPLYLAWSALVSICVGDQDTFRRDHGLYETLAAGLYPLMDARLEFERSARRGCSVTDGRGIPKSAKRLLKSEDGFHVAAVLAVVGSCMEVEPALASKRICRRLVKAAERVEEVRGSVGAWQAEVDGCRERLDSLAASEAAAARVAAEVEARAAEVEARRKAARKAAEEEVLSLRPEFVAVTNAWKEERARAAAPAVVSALSWAGVGGLAVGGVLARIEGDGHFAAAEEAETGEEYDAAEALGSESEARAGVFFGGAAACATAGIVGAIFAGVQSKKSKAWRLRYERFREKLEALEEEAQE